MQFSLLTALFFACMTAVVTAAPVPVVIPPLDVESRENSAREVVAEVAREPSPEPFCSNLLSKHPAENVLKTSLNKPPPISHLSRIPHYLHRYFITISSPPQSLFPFQSSYSTLALRFLLDFSAVPPTFFTTSITALFTLFLQPQILPLPEAIAHSSILHRKLSAALPHRLPSPNPHRS
ncbi:hypothetical protein CVT25_008228 [Psilocybe cyanescens]|uniref:Uncharacterized protein n=1 Tax=Psilocybe cyanescens TaxID=93625 RepID=A0A409X9Q8_PSICY|nr:hypothetical protein CVT25_008228 [Psilocybe cyanescens]